MNFDYKKNKSPSHLAIGVKRDGRVIMAMMIDGQPVTPPSPSCPECHNVFNDFAEVDGVVFSLKASNAQGLAIVTKIHCECGKIIDCDQGRRTL